MAASDAANDGRRVVRTGRTAAPGARERQAPAGRLRNAARKDDLEEEGSARKTVRFGTRRTREQLEECSNAARSVETPAAAAVRNRRDEAAAGRAAGAEAPAEFVLAQPPIIIGGSSVRAGRFTRLTASARRGRTEAAHAEAAQEEVEAVEETKFAAGAAGPNDTLAKEDHHPSLRAVEPGQSLVDSSSVQCGAGEQTGAACESVHSAGSEQPQLAAAGGNSAFGEGGSVSEVATNLSIGVTTPVSVGVRGAHLDRAATAEVFATPTGGGLDDSELGYGQVASGRLQSLSEQVAVLWIQSTGQIEQQRSQTERIQVLYEQTSTLDENVAVLQGLAREEAEQRAQLEKAVVEVQDLVQEVVDNHAQAETGEQDTTMGELQSLVQSEAEVRVRLEQDVRVLQELVQDVADGHAQLESQVDMRFRNFHTSVTQRFSNLTVSPNAKSKEAKGARAQVPQASEAGADEMRASELPAALALLSDRWSETTAAVAACQEQLASVEEVTTTHRLEQVASAQQLQQLRQQVGTMPQLHPLFQQEGLVQQLQQLLHQMPHLQHIVHSHTAHGHQQDEKLGAAINNFHDSLHLSLQRVHSRIDDVTATNSSLEDSVARLEPAVAEINQALNDVEDRVADLHDGAVSGSSSVNSSRGAQLSLQSQLDILHTQVEAHATATRAREAGWEAELLHQGTARRAQTAAFDQAVQETQDRTVTCERALRQINARLLEMEEPPTAPVLQRQWLQQWHASGLADRLAVFEHRLQTLPGQAGRSEVPTDSVGAPARVREAQQPNLLQEFAERLAAQDAAMEGLRAQVARDKDAAAAAVTALQAQLHQERERGRAELAQLRAQVEQEKEELLAQIRDSAGQYEGAAPVPDQLLSLTAELQHLRDRFEATTVIGESGLPVELAHHLRQAMDSEFLLDPKLFQALLSTQLQEDFSYFIDKAAGFTNRMIKQQVTNRLTELMQEVIAIKHHLAMTPPADLEAGAHEHRGQSRQDDRQNDEDTPPYDQYQVLQEEYRRWRPPQSRWQREEVNRPQAQDEEQRRDAMAAQWQQAKEQGDDYHGGGDSPWRTGETFRDYERRHSSSIRSSVGIHSGMRGGMRGSGAAGRWGPEPRSWGETLASPDQLSSPAERLGRGRGRPGQAELRPSFGRGREDRPARPSSMGSWQVAAAPGFPTSTPATPPTYRTEEVTVLHQPTLTAGEVLSYYFEHKHAEFDNASAPIEFDPERKEKRIPPLREDEYWHGDRTRMAHVSSKEVAKQGIFQLLVRLENKFGIHRIELQRQRLLLLYESFSTVPALLDELLATINAERPGGEGLPWREIRKLVLNTFTPPDWWAQTLDLWRAAQKQGDRRGELWLHEFDHWMSVIQQCLPNHERALPAHFEALLLRGGVSIKCHNALLARSVGVNMSDPVLVRKRIKEVCSEAQDGLAGETKKDKGELRRAAAEAAAQSTSAAREALATELGFANQAELSSLTQGASIAGVLKAIRTDRELEAVCKRVHYSGAMADMFHNSGVTEAMFQERMHKMLCVLCGASDHRLYTCPNYSQSKLDELKAKAIQNTQVQMLDRWAGDRAAAERERPRYREQRLRDQVQQLTRSGQNKHFSQNFRTNRAQEMTQGGRAPADDGALKVSQRSQVHSARSARRSARPERSAPPTVHDPRAEHSDEDSRSSFSSDNSALSWQFAEAGNARSGSQLHD